MIGETKTITFQIEGEWLTDFIRRLYYAEAYSHDECKNKLINCLSLKDFTEEQQTELYESIIYGQKKLTGINVFELVDDKDFDVYDYSRFNRPKFKNNEVIGFLLKDGVFVECQYKGHNSTLEWIGEELAQSSLIFGKYSEPYNETYCYTDKDSDILSKQQLLWIDKHNNLLSERQLHNIDKIKKRVSI